MKNKQSHYDHALFIYIAFMLFFTSSCKKFVEIPPAPNLIVSSQVFADSADATSAVLGLYLPAATAGNQLNAYFGNITLYTGLTGDELGTATGSSSENSAYVNNLLSTNSTISTFWASFYSSIYNANAIIEGLSSNTSTSISSTTRNQLLGEAKVVRALMYFDLVNIYGGVPLITSTTYSNNSTLPRTTADSIYAQVIADLTSAQSEMSASYPSQGRVRPNQYTATALLARAYLYTSQWVKAEAAASSVINSSMYTLQQNLNSVFLSTILTPSNTEVIWSILPVQSGYETSEGCIFVPATSTVIPPYLIDTFLLNTFEPGDQRRIDWIDSTVVGGISYYFPYKYKLGIDGNSSPKENYVLLRLSEQYLIRAEARAEQQNITGPTGAIADLNVVRQRAGLQSYNGQTDQADVLAAILHERRVELFCELGHRWFDLKRTGNINAVMAGVCAEKGGTWSSDWQLYPLYHNDLQTNPFLIQNPGYGD